MLGAATDVGLDAICCCEHREASSYAQLLEFLFETNGLGADVVAPGLLHWDARLLVSSGAELELRDGSNVGVHAAPRVLTSLPDAPRALDIVELCDLLAPHEARVVAHHMFYPGKVPARLGDLKGRIHGVELPAKDLVNSELYYRAAHYLRVPLTGGSDAHNFIQVGACCAEAESEPDRGRFPIVDWLDSKDLRPVPSLEAGRLLRLSARYREANSQ